MTTFPTLYTSDGEEIRLPHRWTICPHCQGHGTSSAYLGAFTHDQLREDPDFAEEYMNGAYDRSCDTCQGSGKIAVLDEANTPPHLLAAYQDQQQADAEIRAIERAERLMEGGWRELGWFGE